MKTSENSKYLKSSKSMFFVSLIFSFLPGYVSASGTKKEPHVAPF